MSLLCVLCSRPSVLRVSRCLKDRNSILRHEGDGVVGIVMDWTTLVHHNNTSYPISLMPQDTLSVLQQLMTDPAINHMLTTHQFVGSAICSYLI